MSLLNRFKRFVLFGAYPGQFAVGPVGAEGANPGGGVQTSGPPAIGGSGGIVKPAQVQPPASVPVSSGGPPNYGLTPAQIAQINQSISNQYNAEISRYLGSISAQPVAVAASPPPVAPPPAAPLVVPGQTYSPQFGFGPGPSFFTPVTIAAQQGRTFAGGHPGIIGGGRPTILPPPPIPPVPVPPSGLVPPIPTSNPPFPSTNIVGQPTPSRQCGSGQVYDPVLGGCVAGGQPGELLNFVPGLRGLPEVGRTLARQTGFPETQILRPPFTFGGQFGITPPPSYLRFLESQRGTPSPNSGTIYRQPPEAAPATSDHIFQVGQFCLDCAPGVKGRLQSQCPDCTPDELRQIVSQCNETLSCTPEGMELRAQRLQTEKQIRTERGQETRQEIQQQRSQLQQFKQQEQFPLQSQQQIQRSIQEKEQLLQQIEQELEDLSNQQESLSGSQQISPPNAPRLPNMPSSQGTPNIAQSPTMQGQGISTPSNLPPWSPPAPQRLQVGGIEPYIFCVACETPHDANLFLNGENAACSIMPPGSQTSNLQPTL